MACTYCKNPGHTRATCKSRKQDDAIWKYQQTLLKLEKQEENRKIQELARQTLQEIYSLGFQQLAEKPKPKLENFTVRLD